MCSYLTQDIELRVVQHYVGSDSQTVVKEHCDCLEVGGKLPSYVLEDAEMTELCVRARGDEDWSQDVQLERRDRGSSGFVVQVTAQIQKNDFKPAFSIDISFLSHSTTTAFFTAFLHQLNGVAVARHSSCKEDRPFSETIIRLRHNTIKYLDGRRHYNGMRYRRKVKNE